MLETIAAIARIKLRVPTESDLLDAGITRQMVRSEFGSINAAYALAVDKKLINTDINYIKSGTLSNKKRFVITAAPAGQVVNSKFFESIKLYCKKNNAQLLIIPQKNGKSSMVDPKLERETFITKLITPLNDNISILGVVTDTKTVDSTTGLNRYGRRNTSVIIGASKQNLKYVATGKSRMPHAIMTTGAVTNGTYAAPDLNLMTDKRTLMASSDHVVGAVIIELDTNDTFHFRQVQFDDKAECFYDMGIKYTHNKVSKEAPAALILGDWHSGETDPTVYETFKKMSDALKIKEWVLHDAFNGHSINHHETGNHIVLARKGEGLTLSLRREIREFANDLFALSRHLSSVVIVKSNHDEFLDRYLKEARYKDEPHNHRYALELAIAMIDGHDPLKYAVDPNNKLTKVKWLQRDESYKIGGVELGAHGDRGSNGARRASMQMMENAYGKCVVGHSHSAEIMRDVFRVGTSTEPYPSYGDGPSSWTQTGCLIYKNGMRQLVNVINGKVTTLKL